MFGDGDNSPDDRQDKVMADSKAGQWTQAEDETVLSTQAGQQTQADDEIMVDTRTQLDDSPTFARRSDIMSVDEN
jgi:hypothetical protein